MAGDDSKSAADDTATFTLIALMLYKCFDCFRHQSTEKRSLFCFDFVAVRC